MRYFILLWMLMLFGCQAAMAQHDLYRWQVSGYSGIAHYLNSDNSTSDYIKINDNLLHRLELTRNIGYGVGLSAGYTFGSVRGLDQQQNPFRTDTRMAAARIYFHSDNGLWFHASSWISPYVFVGYGVSILETNNGRTTEESRYVSSIPVGVGIKFRLAERWQLSLQTEAVYLTEPHLVVPALEQNDLNSAYIHTGLTIGYSFGFRESTFKAPRFYANNVPLLQSVEGQNLPRQNVLQAMLKLEPKAVQVETPRAAEVVPQPTITKRNVTLPPDTTYGGTSADTTQVTQLRTAQLVPPAGAQPQDTTQRILTKKATTESAIKVDSAAARSTAQPATPLQKKAIPADTLTQTPPAAAQQQAQPQATPAEATQQQQTEQQRLNTQNQQAEQQRLATQQQQTEQQRVAAQQQQQTEQQRLARQEAGRTQEQQRAYQQGVQQQPVTAAPTRNPVVVQEAGRAQDRVIYMPSATIGTGASTAQLQEERLRLENANAQNRRLQSRIDSLRALPPTTDTLSGTAATVDTTMVQYLQQQAILNDSMLQRLNRYEQELALLAKANAAPAAPASAPPETAASAPLVTAAPATTTVFYPINAHEVPAASLRDLNQVLKTMQQNPTAQVRLSGYTSQSGNPAYNMALSRRRVEGLVAFLTDQGIAKERIIIQYLGDEKASQKENPLDRKVEIEFINP